MVKKSLGQHWLTERAILEEIADLAFFGSEKGANSPKRPLAGSTSPLCLEVGPGLGTLTSSLLKRFSRVIAVEKDDKLAENLPKSFPGKNLEVVHGDFLEYDLDSLEEPYVVAGNIPYYITSPIIDKVLSAKNLPQRVVLLVQKEVAERVAAGKGKYTVLALTAQNRAKVSLGPVVPRELFSPVPKVDSQVIILEPYEQPVVSEQTVALIKRGFVAPRKKLIKNLGQVSRGELEQIFKKLQISLNARPAELELSTWQKLAEAL